MLLLSGGEKGLVCGFVAEGLRGVLELGRVVGGDLDQGRAGVGVVLEFQQDRGLVQGQLVLVESGGDGLGFGDREALLHGVGLGAGALGDRCGGDALERELRPRGGAVREREFGALVVLDDLLHDPVGGRLVAFDDVDGDGGDSGFAGGEGAALSGADDDGAVLVAAGEDRGDDAVLADRRDEVLGDRGAGSDVRLDHEGGRVDVLNGSGGDGHDDFSLIGVRSSRRRVPWF